MTNNAHAHTSSSPGDWLFEIIGDDAGYFSLEDVRETVRRQRGRRHDAEAATDAAFQALLDDGRVRRAGIRMIGGRQHCRLYRVERERSESYRAFCAILERVRPWLRARWTAQALIDAAADVQMLDIEAVDIYLSRCVRERKVFPVGWDRHNEVLFAFVNGANTGREKEAGNGLDPRRPG